MNLKTEIDRYHECNCIIGIVYTDEDGFLLSYKEWNETYLNSFENLDHVSFDGFKFCSNCGHKIDWSLIDATEYYQSKIKAEMNNE